MSLSPKAIVAALIFLALWVLWSFFVFDAVMPWIKLHLSVWHWLASWILCLIPLIIVAAVVIARVSNSRH